MLGEVANDHERGLHTLRVRPQRRVGYRQVAPAMREGEPHAVADFLSCEALVEIPLQRLLKILHSHKVGYVHPDDRRGRQAPSPREGWGHLLIAVISSDDAYAVG